MIRNGVILGICIAFVQSLISVLAMKWAFNKKSFYWVWGGGFFFRILVFAITAFVVFRMPQFHFAATLISLALGTMIFLVTESSILFWNKSNK